MAKRLCSFCGAEYNGLVLVGQPAMCPACQAASRSLGVGTRAIMWASVLGAFALGAWVGWKLFGA